MKRSICIVGAGAAGLTLAHALATRDVRIILIEGGSVEPVDELEDTYRVENVGVPHRGAHAGRFRALGGSTTRWGGQLWGWEPHEFQPRPHLQLEGWPLPYADVAAWYPRAFSMLGLPDGTLSPEAAAARGVRLPDLDPAIFSLKYSAWLPWRLRNLGRTVGAALRGRTNVDVQLGTTALALILDSTGERATAVRVRTPAGAVRDIAADIIIVATGAIESTRLLFASSLPSGLGNAGGWLGRGFMDHLSVRIGRFRPRDDRAFSEMFAPVFVRRAQHTPRMVLRPEVLGRDGLLGAYGHWDVTLPPDSGVLFLRDRLRALQRADKFRFAMSDFGRAFSAVRDVLELAHGVVVDGRRNFPRVSEINLRIDTEQRPSWESRVFPTGSRDSLGLPRMAVDWRVSDVEKWTVRRTAELLTGELERCGIGSLDPSPDPFSDAVPWGDLKGDSFHMMGGTRMALGERDGVVDTSCRLFGTDNVFVAGASTFPTGGMANPTLTVIALALRLANQLAPE